MTALSITLPHDSAAVALGAEEVAAALQREAAARGLDLRLVRTGSRGAHWLEPLLEVTVDGVRHGFGPLTPDDVPGLIDSGFAADHPCALGPVAALPWLAGQTRQMFARCGVIDPLDLADYTAHGGLAGLRQALALMSGAGDGQAIVDAIQQSGLRGRGGAGFPSAIKWQTVQAARAATKYVVCNADEGDSGTFADRMILEGDPLLLIEGMAIAGLAVGAARGLVYLRSEYPIAARVFRQALGVAREGGLLGDSVLGSSRAFDIDLVIGAGAYICGEESSLLNSLENRRGEVRARPPIPAVAGLHGQPTLLHNVLSLCAVPAILADGAARYHALGHGRSTGTMAFQLAGNVARGGLVEVPFGISLRQLVEDFAGGTRSGRPVRAVQVGGPLGAYLPDALLDVPMDYEALAALGAGLGHGGIVVFDDSVNLAAQARYAFAFCAAESCGKCTPCRIGAVRGVETMDRIIEAAARGEAIGDTLALLTDLCEVMEDGSLCAMGGMTPVPVKSALTHFAGDFGLPAPAGAART